MKQRVLTALIAAPLVLFCLLGPYIGLAVGLIALVSLLGIYELFGLLKAQKAASGAVGKSGWIFGLTLVAYALCAAGVLLVSTRATILLPILPVWAADTAAIFAGRACGKRKLAPAVSPNKTWEGAIAGLIAGLVMGALLAPSVGQTLALGIVAGMACGALGVLGDLWESSIKRAAGAKDSGTLFPGHGGVLDRIDSLILPGIVVYGVILLMRPGG